MEWFFMPMISSGASIELDNMITSGTRENTQIAQVGSLVRECIQVLKKDREHGFLQGVNLQRLFSEVLKDQLDENQLKTIKAIVKRQIEILSSLLWEFDVAVESPEDLIIPTISSDSSRAEVLRDFCIDLSKSIVAFRERPHQVCV